MHNLTKEEYEELRYDDCIEELSDDNAFMIHQSYADRPLATITCKKCKSRNLIVGVDDHYIAVKCEKCGWQICLSNG